MIKKNDVLKSKRGFEDRKVLEIYGDIYFLGYEQYGDTSIDIVNLKKLERDYVIPKEEWTPEYGETYCFVSDCKPFGYNIWRGDEIDKYRLDSIFGIHQTRELAEQALAEIKRKIKK